MDLDPIRTLLLPQERILWEGRPVQGFIANIRDARLLPSILFGVGLSGFFLYGDMSVDESVSFILLAKIAALISGCAVLAQLAFDAWLRRWMVYTVTSMRVLISRTGPFPGICALDVDLLGQIKIVDETKTYGSLYFLLPDQHNRVITLFNCMQLLNPPSSFSKIEGAEKVFKIVMKAAQERRAEKSH